MPTPSPIHHVEPVLQAGFDSIKQQFPAALDSQTALAASLGLPALTLDHPDPELGYAFGGSEPYVYPLVEIAAPDGSLSDFALYQHSADHDATVLIRCQVTDATPELIYRRTLRYGAALVYVVIQPGCFGPGYVLDNDQGDPLRYAYRGWNIETQDGAPPMRAGGVLLSVKLAGGEVRI